MLPRRKYKTRKAENTPGEAHELTFSCYRRLPLLDEDRTRLWLIESLHAARREHEFHLWAYVIMPDHVHVLLFPQGPIYSIEAILRATKQPVGRRALNWLRQNDPARLSQLKGERAGPRQRFHFWQPGGGYDRNIDSIETARSSVAYIHNNPVRRGLVTSPTDWPWSSAGWYTGDKAHLAMDAME